MKAKRKTKTAVDERHAVFVQLIDELFAMSHEERVDVAEEAGISISTIYTWVYGVTRSPHFRTLHRVASALGYDVCLYRQRDKAKLYRIA